MPKKKTVGEENLELSMAFYDKLVPVLTKVLDNNYAPVGWLEFYSGIDDKIANTPSIRYSGNVLCLLKLAGKDKYISMSTSSHSKATSMGLTSKPDTKGGYIRYSLKEIDDSTFEKISDLVCNELQGLISSWPRDFDCCGRYAQCSDNRACVHPSREQSMGCTYKKRLREGFIFYGENRTQNL